MRRHQAHRRWPWALAGIGLIAALSAPMATSSALFTDQDAPDSTSAATARLVPVTGLSATLTDGVATLDWDAPALRPDVAAAYTLERSTRADGTDPESVPVGSGATQITDDLTRDPQITTADLTQLAAGTNHTCGLTADGAAYCWGSNSRGQLGDGTTTDSITPTQVIGGHTFAALAAGHSHTCGITPAGDAYCWGRNFDGELGTGETSRQPNPTPTLVTGGHTYTMLTAGSGASHTCGIVPGGAAHCWGRNGYGQIGTGATGAPVPTPAIVTGGHTYTTLAVGVAHTCGITADGVAHCWGWNVTGQLGIGNTTDQPTPTPVTGVHTYTTLAPGYFHTCGITQTGDAYCWGHNLRGQIGIGAASGEFFPNPTLVTGGRTYTSLTVGAGQNCATTGAGGTFCWGQNGSGQLGIGNTTDQPTPTPVSGGRTYLTLKAGSSHTCGTVHSGDTYCWGLNNVGQLGDGTTTGQTTPTPVAPITQTTCDDGYELLDGPTCAPDADQTFFYRLTYTQRGWTAPFTDWIPAARP